MDLANPGLMLQVAYGLVFLLLISVTGGIVYLTWIDWKDKRLRKQLEGTPPARSPQSRSKVKPAKSTKRSQR